MLGCFCPTLGKKKQKAKPKEDELTDKLSVDEVYVLGNPPTLTGRPRAMYSGAKAYPGVWK